MCEPRIYVGASCGPYAASVRLVVICNIPFHYSCAVMKHDLFAFALRKAALSDKMLSGILDADRFNAGDLGAPSACLNDSDCTSQEREYWVGRTNAVGDSERHSSLVKEGVDLVFAEVSFAQCLEQSELVGPALSGIMQIPSPSPRSRPRHAIGTAAHRGNIQSSDEHGTIAPPRRWAMHQQGLHMIGTLIGLIFFCIIIGVVWWGLQELLTLIPVAEPFRTIIRILTVVIMVIIVIYVAIILLGVAGIHVNTFPIR
jgi:hypothetical protein